MSLNQQPSWRKPFGTLLIVGLITAWAVLVATASVLLEGWAWPFHVIYYLAAGILWIFPLKPLLIWMETGRWKKPAQP